MKKVKILNIKIFDIFRYSKLAIRDFNRGFALVELLVALAVFGIITAIMLVSYNRVRGQLFLSDLAYEIALSFRQVQSYGVSVHEFRPTLGNATFDVGYGLHFDAGSLDTYVLFADKGGSTTGNGRFDGAYGTEYTETGCNPAAIECVQVFRIEKGNRISRFCGIRADTGAEECALTFLDVTFLRPNPDAIIKTNETFTLGRQYKTARVYIVSPTGNNRKIDVWNTGQIAIE